MFLFTHDIDWLVAQHPISIAKTLSGKKWLTVKQLFQNDILLKNIADTIEFEKTNQVHALNLIGIQKKVNTFQNTGIRYAYTHPFLSSLVQLCKQNKLPMGLHVNTIEPMTFQVEQFEKLTGYVPIYIRTHYLKKLSLHQQSELKQLGIQYDLSSGSATTVGFSTTNHQSPFNDIPTVISDNNFVRINDDKKVWLRFDEFLIQIKQSPKLVSVLFHPENLLTYPELKNIYVQLIAKIKQSQIEIAAPKIV